jgi:hypothetical protein
VAAVLVAGVVASGLTAAAGAAETPPVIYDNAKEVTTTRVPALAWGELRLHTVVLGRITCTASFFGEAWNQHENMEAGKPVRGYGEVLEFGASDCEDPEEIAYLEAAHKKEVEEGKIEHPITVTVTVEMPLEKIQRLAEVCKESTKKLAQCSNTSEREVRSMISEFHRRGSSLPWKVELMRGERELEEGVLQKVGLHEFGESGTALAHTTKCYPKEAEHPATFKVLPAGCVALNVLFPQVPAEFVWYGTQEIWSLNGARNGLSPSRVEFIEAGTLVSSEGLDGEANLTSPLKVLGSNGQELLTAR